MRTSRSAILAICISLPLIAGLSACYGEVAETTVTYTTPAAEIDSVTATTVNGNVTIVGEPSRADISVETHIVARDADRDEAQQLFDAVPIIRELVGPERRFVIRFDSDDDRYDGVQVNFTVRVPSRIGVVAKTVSGDVKVSDVRSATGRSVNGTVTLSRVGAADGGTLNGAIRVSECTGPVIVRTLNGHVECSVAGAGNSIEVKTLIGSVEIEIPAEWPAEFDLKSLIGIKNVHALGSGLGRLGGASRDDVPCVRVRTLIGSIDIRRL